MDNVWQLIGLGAVAGVFPIYLGIGLALLIAKGINRSLEGYLTGIATGVLVYLFFDLMHEAVEQTGAQTHCPGWPFWEACSSDTSDWS
jgi:ZIP family zinc transporter